MSDLINRVVNCLEAPKQRISELVSLCKELCNHSVNINCSSCVTEGVMLLSNWLKQNNVEAKAQTYFKMAVNGEYEFKPINLFVQYYQCGNEERQKELDACSRINHQKKHFHKIFSLTERLTYRQIFELTKEYDDCINVIANSDIFFDETILYSRFMGEKDCYALSRWDYYNNGVCSLYDKENSQDVWIFNGSVKEVNNCDFYLGILGCDSRVAHEIKQAGYNILNPSKTIHAIHLHNSGFRTYKNVEPIAGPYYYIKPHS